MNNRTPTHGNVGSPSRLLFAAGWTVTLAAAGAAFWGTPWMRQRWSWPTLAMAAAGLAVGVFLMVHSGPGLPRRVRRWALTALAVLVVLFGVGAATQVVIDGRPYLSASQEARSYRLAQTLYDDLRTMATYDELLDLPVPDARARYNQYEPAIQHLDELVAKWSRYDLGSLPDPDFIDVITNLKVGGTFGANALQLRFQLLTQPDVRSEQALAENRAAYISAVLEAGNALRTIAERYDVRLFDPKVVE